jgi:lysine biosynthesis protein LysW
MAACPDCDAPIRWRERMRLGQVFRCPECGARLEVISLQPFDVDYYLDDEDWKDQMPKTSRRSLWAKTSKKRW